MAQVPQPDIQRSLHCKDVAKCAFILNDVKEENFSSDKVKIEIPDDTGITPLAEAMPQDCITLERSPHDIALKDEVNLEAESLQNSSFKSEIDDRIAPACEVQASMLLDYSGVHATGIVATSALELAKPENVSTTAGPVVHQQSNEPCVEFCTIKVEPLDYLHPDTDSCERWSPPPPPPTNYVECRPGADVPEPGFSMTVPLKTLKEAVKNAAKEKKNEFVCERCNKKYNNKMRLERHMYKHLGIKLDKIIRCEFCSKTFKQHYQLVKHSVLHTLERPFSCALCDKTFGYQASLYLHMKRHTDTQEVCDECGKVFYSHQGVDRHKKRMHDPHASAEHRPFACAHCGAKFRNNRNLTVHYRTHTGDRPHACLYCHKSFADTGTLNRHVRIHTGVKPYACELCPKSFSDSGSLKFHVRKHHTGERPHQCPYCNTAYHHHSNLKRHLKTHLQGEGGGGGGGGAAPRPAKRNAKPKQKRAKKVVVKTEINFD